MQIADKVNNVQESSEMIKSGYITQPIFMDQFYLNTEQLFFPTYYEKYVHKILIPHGLIQDRIEKLAHDILNTFRNESFHLICLLKGSSHFFSSLMKNISKIKIYKADCDNHAPYYEHYVRVKSYINDRPNEKQELEILSEDLSCLAGKHVVIVEDIIDTGNTLGKFLVWLQKLNPKDIYIASLLEKRNINTNGIKANFSGFSVPDLFLIGYGLDYNEVTFFKPDLFVLILPFLTQKFRDLEHICVIKSEAIEELKI